MNNQVGVKLTFFNALPSSNNSSSITLTSLVVQVIKSFPRHSGAVYKNAQDNIPRKSINLLIKFSLRYVCGLRYNVFWVWDY